MAKTATYPDQAALARVGKRVRERLAADDQAYRVETDVAEIFAIGDFLSAQECQRLMDMIDAVAHPSHLYDRDYSDGFRTSYSGDLDPDDGVARLGPSVQLSRLDQARATLASNEPLLEVAETATGATTEEVRTTFAKLGLDQRDIVRPASNLSPGERTRALLGVFMLRPANTLVLDEPTNHLDLPAIEELGRALADFGGTVIVVSHDRTFIEELELSREVTLTDGVLTADRPLA